MNPKTTKKDSESFVPSNAFDEFNNSITGQQADVVKGKRVAPEKKDSQQMGVKPVEPNVFEDFNESIKKKEQPIPGAGDDPNSGLKSAASQGASTYSSNGDDEYAKSKEELQNASAFLKDDINKTLQQRAGQSIYPAVMGQNGQPLPIQPGQNQSILDNPLQSNGGVSKMPDDMRIMKNPEDMSKYLNQRSEEINKQIRDMTRQRDQKYTKDVAIAIPYSPGGLGVPAVKDITDKPAYDKMTGEITNLNNYLKSLQKSSARIVSDQLIEKTMQKQKASIGIPRELGRDIVRYADKQTNDQYEALEQDGTPLGPVPNADLEMIGLQAWKNYLLTHDEVPNRDARIADLIQWSDEFDERNFELTGARVRHKLGAYLQQHSGFGSSIFRRQPGESEIVDAANKAGLTPSEMKVFNSYVLPVEKGNIGTDIPMSGFFNKFGEAVGGNIDNLGNLFRGDNARLQDALNKEVDTRYDEVGEFQRDNQELAALEKKAKTKEGVTADDKKRITELKQYNDVRNWYDKFWDGAGDLTGQVAYQAGLARLFGGVGNLASKTPVIGGLLSKASTIAGGPDMINLMMTSFITSYDGHAQEAVQLMPRKDQALQRRMYAYTMSAIEGLSERIFPDTKVLDAFKKEVAPNVVKMAARLSAGEITEEAAKSRMKSFLTNSLKPFAKSFVKSELEESSEEAITDIAQGISETVFAGKDFDAEKTFGNAANTFLTTMAYSPFVSGLAAAKDTRAGSYGKSGIYKMATDPETYRREIERLKGQGMSDAEADQKLQVINTAAEIARQLPVKKSLDMKKNPELQELNSQWKKNIQAIGERTDIDEAEKEKLKQAEDDRSSKEVSEYIKNQNKVNSIALDYGDRVSYTTHRLNEALLDKQIATTTDEVVKKDLIAQRDRSHKIREGIYRGDVIVGNNLQDIATNDKTAQELGLPTVDEVDDDTLPNNISKSKTDQNEKQGNTAEKQQTGEESSSGQNVGEQDQTGQQPVREKQAEELKKTTPVKEGKTSLPAGMSESQFKRLPKATQEKILARQQQEAPAPPYPNVTEDAQKMLGSIDSGSKPAFVTKNMKRIAEQNGITVTDKSTPDEIINALKEKGGNNAIQEQSPTESVLRDERVREEGELQKVEQGNEPKKVTSEEKEVIEAVRNHPKTPDYIKGVLDSNPQDVIKAIQDQLTGRDSEGNSRQVLDEQAVSMFGQEAVDKARALMPKQEVKATKNAAQEADVTYEPLKDIDTDTKRFQPRQADFSKESVDKIVKEYDENKLDPIVVFPDENGKQYVLAGHSRLEAHRILSELPDSDPRKQRAIENGFQDGKIKTRYYKGTEEQAKEFADRSNDLGTKNKDYESAASLRKAREKGQSKKSIKERAKDDFGKNWNYYYNMSFLNPNGKALQTLKQFEDNPDKATQNQIEKSVSWIGSVREKLGEEITDRHENEMFDYLMDKTRSTKLDRESDFVNLVGNIVGKIDYNPNEPLNLARLKNKSAAEINYDAEEADLKTSIKDKQRDLDDLNDRFNNPQNPAYINPNASDYAATQKVADQKRQLINQQLKLLRSELMEHQQNKGKTISSGLAQPGLFDMNNLSPEEQETLNNELKPTGITVQDINDYEKQQDLSDPGQLPQEDRGNAGETSTVSENVPPAQNDEGPGTQQDQSSSAVQGQQRTSPAVALTPAQTAIYERAKELLPQITLPMKTADKVLWQASAHAAVLVENIETGKYPNGKKINVQETLDQLQADVEKMNAALTGNRATRTRADRATNPAVKKMANELASLLGKGPVALRYDNAKEWIYFQDIGLTPDMNNEQIIQKLIGYNGPFSDIFRAVAADPNFKNLRIQLMDERQGPNGESGLYHPTGYPGELENTLQIWNKDNTYYTAAHEMLHFLTLDGSVAEQMKGTPSYQALEDFYNYIVSEKGQPVFGTANITNYGLTDVKEFMAELLINPKFRENAADVYAKNFDEIYEKSTDVRNRSKSLGELIQNFFRDMFSRIFSSSQATTPDVGFNANESVIDNAARLAANLFLNPQGQENQQPGRVLSMQERQQSAAALNPLALPSLADQDASKIISGFVAAKKAEGQPDADIKEALMLNGVSSEDADSFLTDGPAPKVTGTDLALQQKQNNLAAAKAAFKDSLRKSLGKANVSIGMIDPEVIANGVKLIGAYADLGLYKFKEILRDIADTFGPDYLDKQNVDALKGVYSYYRSNLPREERSLFDNEDAVDDFIDNQLQLPKETIDNGTSTANDLATDSTRGTTTNTVGTGYVSTPGERNDVEVGTDGGDVIQPIQPVSSPGLFPFDAPTIRATGDNGLSDTERPIESAESIAGTGNSGGSNSIKEIGVPFERGTSESVNQRAPAVTGQSISEKL